MRIAVLCTATTRHQAGGTEVHAEFIARLAAAKGHTVTCITSAREDGAEQETKDGYTTCYLPGTDHRMSRSQAPAWWRESAKKISELAAKDGLDVIWAENLSGQYYASRFRERVGVPVISIIQGLGVAGEIKSAYGRVDSFGELAYFLTRYAAQIVFYYIPRFRRMVRFSDRLIAISRETLEAVAAEYPSAREKLRLVYNFIDTRRFRPDAELRDRTRAALGIPRDARLLLLCGVAHRQKGFHIGVEAFKRVLGEIPGARLLLVGNGPELPALKKLVSDEKLEASVIFAGNVPNENLPAYYNAADLYLNPTLRQEGLGIVIIEAMACGLPSVVSRIGGTGSTIDDGVSGFFVPAGDAAALGVRAVEVLKNKELARAMSAAAREKALRVFSEKNIDHYLEISREIARDLS